MHFMSTYKRENEIKRIFSDKNYEKHSVVLTKILINVTIRILKERREVLWLILI